MATYTFSLMGFNTDKSFRSVKQDRLRIVDRIVDLNDTLPGETVGVTQPAAGHIWARDDVIECVGVRNDWTVMGVEVEILRQNTWGAGAGQGYGATALDTVALKPERVAGSPMMSIGYGSDTDRWGEVALDAATGWIDPMSNTNVSTVDNSWWRPVHMTAGDTIDIKFTSHVVSPGPNLITGSAMAADTGWTIDGTQWDISGGVLVRVANATLLTAINTMASEALESYLVAYDMPVYTAGTAICSLGGMNNGSTDPTAVVTNYRWETGPVRNTDAFTFTAVAASDLSLDNVYAYKYRRLDAKFRIRVYYLRDYMQKGWR